MFWYDPTLLILIPGILLALAVIAGGAAAVFPDCRRDAGLINAY